MTVLLVFGAYQAAQTKLSTPLNLSSLNLGMSAEKVIDTFGTPSAKTRNQMTFILTDGSELTVTLRDELVSSAKVRFQQVLKIQDPEMKRLALVQMDMREDEGNRPGWFFAGKPEEGLIYKITTEGIIESLTWVPPFSYGNNRPKHLQALLQDFKGQRRL